MTEGYTGDTYCTICKELIATGSAISALGHNYTSKVTKEPTTTETGIRTYTCSRCDDTYTEVITKITEPQNPVTPPSNNNGTGNNSSTSNNTNSNVNSNNTNINHNDEDKKPSDPSIDKLEPTTSVETKPDGTKVETITETKEDGTVKKTVTETRPDGTIISTVTETKANGLEVQVKEIHEKDNGAVLVTTIETDKEGKTNANSIIYTGELDKDGMTEIAENLLENVAKDEKVDSVIIKITDTTIKSAVNNNKNTTVAVTIPFVEDVEIEKVILTKESMEAAKEKGKGLVINIIANKDNTLSLDNYKITIPAKQLAKIDSSIQELNITINTESVSNIANSSKKDAIIKVVNKNKGDEKKTCVVSIAENENLNAGMKVTVPVADKTEISKGNTVYIYKYDAETKKLIETANCKQKVSADGNVTIVVINGTDYVVSAKKLKGNKVEEIKDHIFVAVSKTIKVKKTLKIKTTFPDTVSTKAKFGAEKATITYKSSDKKIASVSKNGVVTAKKKGKVRITTTIKLASGQKVVKKQAITVKK